MKNKLKNIDYKKHLNNLLKGIFAGIMIGIGGIVFLSLENKIVGALLFSIGLLTICMYGMNLYTGKIGYILINKPLYLIELFISLIGNFIGTYITSLAILNTRFASLSEISKNISYIKLNDSPLSIIINILWNINVYRS